ncbi:MAG: hypothetical protein CVU84_15835 [Firmicutes bacterium HGW-Firmicutes-1]|jgi:DNA-directed RNA polymerase subunit RPC12/RpoP|nr:MAG: hypothetical protein CVU84_15835 [Firmicutes bacterium HGW-Firmicutes-1]
MDKLKKRKCLFCGSNRLEKGRPTKNVVLLVKELELKKPSDFYTSNYICLDCGYIHKFADVKAYEHYKADIQ